MRTIGRNWHHGLCGAGRCDICGVNWPMNQLRKNGDGMWACPDDIDGLTRTELAEFESEAAGEDGIYKTDQEMASYDGGEEL